MRREMISGEFTGRERSLTSPWCWIREDAAELSDALRAGPPGADSGQELLWRTKNKYVLRVKTASGLDLACKWYVRVRQAPYSFSWTLAAKEAYNFKRLSRIGLPLVKLVAAGEDRGFLYIRNCFLITEFAEGFSDGRCFCFPNSYDIALCDEFTRRNLILVARMHDAGFWHGGFSPMNALMRKLPKPDAEGNQLEIRWIDVATCHRSQGWFLKRRIVNDLCNYLRFCSFTQEERRGFLRVYLDATTVKRFDLDSLCRAVEEDIAARIRREEVKAARKAAKNKANA